MNNFIKVFCALFIPSETIIASTSSENSDHSPLAPVDDELLDFLFCFTKQFQINALSNSTLKQIKNLHSQHYNGRATHWAIWHFIKTVHTDLSALEAVVNDYLQSLDSLNCAESRNFCSLFNEFRMFLNVVNLSSSEEKGEEFWSKKVAGEIDIFAFVRLQKTISSFRNYVQWFFHLPDYQNEVRALISLTKEPSISKFFNSFP